MRLNAIEHMNTMNTTTTINTNRHFRCFTSFFLKNRHCGGGRRSLRTSIQHHAFHVQRRCPGLPDVFKLAGQWHCQWCDWRPHHHRRGSTRSKSIANTGGTHDWGKPCFPPCLLIFNTVSILSSDSLYDPSQC